MKKEVVRAIYGDIGNYCNVTYKILAENIDIFKIEVSNQLFGYDPCYGRRKKLFLLYNENGKNYLSNISEGCVFSSGQEIEVDEGVEKLNELMLKNDKQHMIHDIFIKSCKKDQKWLEFCLKAIDKYAKGFRQVVIVADCGDKMSFDELELKIPIKYVEVDVPKIEYNYQFGVGYWWQQGIKLSWNLFSDADAVVMIDSDCMCYNYVAPMDWYFYDKPIWLYTKWEEAVKCLTWKKGIDFLYEFESSNSYMTAQGFYITKKLLIKFQSFLLDKYNQHPLGLFLNRNYPALSEYNLLGTFLEVNNLNEYARIETKTMPCLWQVKQYWSWGGIKENLEELDKITT